MTSSFQRSVGKVYLIRHTDLSKRDICVS